MSNEYRPNNPLQNWTLDNNGYESELIEMNVMGDIITQVLQNGMFNEVEAENAATAQTGLELEMDKRIGGDIV